MSFLEDSTFALFHFLPNFVHMQTSFLCDLSALWLNHSANVTLDTLPQIFSPVRAVVLGRCQHLCCLPVWSKNSHWTQLMSMSFYNCQIHSGCKWISLCILRVDLHIVFQLLTSNCITNITELAMSLMTFLESLCSQHHDYLIHCSGSPQYEYMGTILHFKKDIMVFPMFRELLLMDNEWRMGMDEREQRRRNKTVRN